MRVAKMHRRISRQRLDFHHKQALKLVEGFDLIVHERLNIAGMTRAPKPQPDPETSGQYLPNGAAAKAGLNKSILDAGWSQFLAILAAKAENAGRLIVAVNPRHSSQTCHSCWHVDAASREGITFRCTRCGHEDHADVNAARNLLGPGWPTSRPDDLAGSPRR